MAEVTERGAARKQRPATDGTALPSAAALPPDARATRVTLAAVSRLGAEPPVVVSPGPARDREAVPGDRPHVLVDGVPAEIALRHLGRDRARFVDGAGRATQVVFASEAALGADGVRRRELLVDGWRIEVEIEGERRVVLRERARRDRATSAHGGPSEVRAIIPGRVVGVSVAPGDVVAAGDQLLIVEAMKMQNELRAPREGTIERVAVGPGTTIEIGDLLIVIA